MPIRHALENLHVPARTIRLRLPLALACAAMVGAPATAAAATVSATSAASGFAATIDGTTLTVSPAGPSSSALLASVQGREVFVACASGIGPLLADGAPDGDNLPRAFDVSALGGSTVWPAGARSFSFALARDVSATVDGCALAAERGDLGVAFGFSDVGRLLGAEAEEATRLGLAHAAAKTVARERSDRRFPPARRLAAAIAASEPQLTVRVVRDARGAKRAGVVYILRRGSDFKRVRLAHRIARGAGLTVVDGRRRGALADDAAGLDPTEIISGERGRF